jgi:ubiquinone/menaquinone biosynthesis C-methylase UbiE
MYDARYAEEQEAKYHSALASIETSGLILDVGCGTGLLFRHIASKAKDVVGVDVSKSLLLHAKARAHKSQNVDLVQADADHLPFKNNKFNTVFAFTVLQNMPKPLETMMEIHRTAAFSAYVVITGLKKIFSTKVFMMMLHDSGFRPVSLKNEEKLTCYLAFGRKEP